MMVGLSVGWKPFSGVKESHTGVHDALVIRESVGFDALDPARVLLRRYRPNNTLRQRPTIYGDFIKLMHLWKASIFYFWMVTAIIMGMAYRAPRAGNATRLEGLAPLGSEAAISAY